MFKKAFWMKVLPVVVGGLIFTFLVNWGNNSDIPVLKQVASGDVGSQGWFNLGIGPF